MNRMFENVGATSRSPKGLHGLYRDNVTFFFLPYIRQLGLLSWYSDGLQTVRSSEEAEDFSLLHSVQTAYVVQRNSYPVGNAGSFPEGVKRPKRESDLPPSPSVNAKTDEATPPLPHTSS
jgi:hypothetical protein